MTAEAGEPLRVEAMRAALAGSRFGHGLVVLDEVTSSNDYVWERAQAGAEAGLIVFAERQTAARGQRGNRWEAAVGQGLWFSFLLRPPITPVESARLTDWAAASVAETIAAELSLAPTIKAPNDVLIDGRKVSGVLVEMRVEAGGRYAAIAGIGVNVNHCAEDFSEEVRMRATSLRLAVGCEVDRTAFAIALTRRLECSYEERFGW